MIVKWGLGLLVTLVRWSQAVATLLFISSVSTNTVLSPICSVMEKKKKRFYIFFISVLEKQSIRNSTLVFDDCFLPLKYLRFERIIGNLFVVTFFESTLFLFGLF